MLRKYGFECGCRVRGAEAVTEGQKLKRQVQITKEITRLLEKEAVAFETYLAKLEELNRCYSSPPEVEPRKLHVTPVMNILAELKRTSMWTQVVELVGRLLA